MTARHLPSPTQIGVFRTIIAACGVTTPDTQQRWIDTLLRVRRASDGRAARQTARGAGPYRGLLPFEAQDAALFFGREAFVSQILSKLHELKHRAPAAQPEVVSRLVFLVGASGSGKSSVLRAGVYSAAIARTPGDAEQWHATVITPGRDPMSSLDTAFRDTPEPRVVVIDQFEELYTLASDDVRDRFISRLAAAGDQTVLVAGLRADFFTQAARDPRLVPGAAGLAAGRPAHVPRRIAGSHRRAGAGERGHGRAEPGRRGAVRSVSAPGRTRRATAPARASAAVARAGGDMGAPRARTADAR